MIQSWRNGAAGAAVLAMLTACGGTDESVALLTGGSPDRGKASLGAFGCSACHSIPGVPGAAGQVGPPLGGIAGRAYLGGVVPNTPENMVRWIMDPPALAPRTAMPVLGVSPAVARDMAAYLYTLR